MNLYTVVPAVLSQIADLYAGTGYPPVQTPAALLRLLPKRYKVDAGVVPAVVSCLPQALRQVPPNLGSQTLLDFAASDFWRAGSITFPTSFQGCSAILEILGPEGLAVNPALRCGLYLQSPNCLYPCHSHAAEEFYLVLGGQACWQRGEADFAVKDPGTLIHHEPGEIHAMRTLNEPLLALWIWGGKDVTYKTYHIG